jgi:hypothetical protein
MSLAPAKNAVGFEGMCPILRVKSVAASVEYYVQKLSFKIDWQTPCFCSVSRGRCHIFLSEGDQGEIPAPGYGSASKTPKLCSTNTRPAERKYAIPLQTTPGRTKCR